VLAIGVKQGDVVYVGDEKLHVMEVRGMEYARVWVAGKVYTLTDQEQIEVLPDVLISCGAPQTRETFYRKEGKYVLGELQPRLNFNAPPSVRILRSSVYERMSHATTA